MGPGCGSVAGGVPTADSPHPERCAGQCHQRGPGPSRLCIGPMWGLWEGLLCAVVHYLGCMLPQHVGMLVVVSCAPGEPSACIWAHT